MQRLIFALLAVLILASAPRAHADPKGGYGAEPLPRHPKLEVLSAESRLHTLAPCGRNYYPHLDYERRAREAASADSLSPGEVTALALGALAVLATAFVLVSSRARRPRRGRAAATASGP